MKFLILILSLILFTSGMVGISFGATTERGIEFAIIDLESLLESDDDYWNPNTPAQVTLTDGDMNKDPTISEKIIFSNSYDYVLEPHPDIPVEDFMYKLSGSMPYLSFYDRNAVGIEWDDPFSFNNEELDYVFPQTPNSVIGKTKDSITYVQSGDYFSIDSDQFLTEIDQHISEPKIRHFLNYDVSSLNTKLSTGGINSFSITIENENDSVILIDDTSNFKNYFLLESSKLTEIENLLGSGDVTFKINLLNVQPNSQYSAQTILPIFIDVFRFGVDTSKQNELIFDSIFRLELQETGNDTGIFVGSVSWVEITKFNIETFDFASLDTVGTDIVFPSTNNQHDEDGIRLHYYDFGMDGVWTNLQDQADVQGSPDRFDNNPPTIINVDEEMSVYVDFNVPFVLEQEFDNGDMPLFIEFDETTNKHIVTPFDNFFGTWNENWLYYDVYENSYVSVPIELTVNPSYDPITLVDDNGNSINPQSLTVFEDTPLTANIHNYCSDELRVFMDCIRSLTDGIAVNNPDLSEITFTVIDEPNHGIVTGTTDIVFTPDLNYVGEDSMILAISDGTTTENLSVNIYVQPIDDIPVANAGADQSVDSGSTVTLDGSNSSDADGDSITYHWIQTSGYIVTLTDDASEKPQFSVPNIDDTLTFMLTVSDGTTTSNPDVVNVIVGTVTNNIPVANAGADQSVDSGSTVTLDGSNSSDADGDSITYHWIQTAGYPTTLSDDTVVNPQLTSPNSGDTLSYMLTVSDGTATSNPDVVNVYVNSSVPEPTVPPAPSSVSSNPSDSTVVLTWQAPDDGGSPITDYVVEYKSANSSWNTYDDGVSSNTISIISGLENNVAYQFRITAVNSVGTSDSSSIISATPISSTPVAETPTVPQPELGIASFVDQTKNPQSYVDRYNNEPAYKQWFDDNYSQYDSIYQAVGLDEPSEESVLEIPVEPEPEMISESGYTPEPVFAPEPVMEQEVTCGPGTELVNDVCQAIPNFKSEQEVNCGPGTESVNGICEVIQTEEKSSNGGGCLIATATYGSEMSQQVQQLRELRDNQLLQTESGTAFMSTFNDVYYSFSPIIADYERENPLFKEAVKLAITPMISSLSLMENANSESEVLSIGISVIMLNLGMYLAVPAIVIVGIKKKF